MDKMAFFTSGRYEVWPPSNPDCNPLDFYVWGVAKRDVNWHPTTPRPPWSQRSWRYSTTCPGRRSGTPAAGSGNALRRSLKWTGIFLNKNLNYMLIKISTNFYNSDLIITIIFWEREKSSVFRRNTGRTLYIHILTTLIVSILISATTTKPYW